MERGHLLCSKWERMALCTDGRICGRVPGLFPMARLASDLEGFDDLFCPSGRNCNRPVIPSYCSVGQNTNYLATGSKPVLEGTLLRTIGMLTVCTVAGSSRSLRYSEAPAGRGT